MKYNGDMIFGHKAYIHLKAYTLKSVLKKNHVTKILHLGNEQFLSKGRPDT